MSSVLKGLFCRYCVVGYKIKCLEFSYIPTITILTQCAFILLGGCCGPKNVVLNLTNFSRDVMVIFRRINIFYFEKRILQRHMFLYVPNKMTLSNDAFHAVKEN